MKTFDRWGVCTFMVCRFALLPKRVESRQGATTVWLEKYYEIIHVRQGSIIPWSNRGPTYSVLGSYKTKWDCREHFRGRHKNWMKNRELFKKFAMIYNKKYLK